MKKKVHYGGHSFPVHSKQLYQSISRLDCAASSPSSGAQVRCLQRSPSVNLPTTSPSMAALTSHNAPRWLHIDPFDSNLWGSISCTVSLNNLLLSNSLLLLSLLPSLISPQVNSTGMTEGSYKLRRNLRGIGSVYHTVI